MGRFRLEKIEVQFSAIVARLRLVFGRKVPSRPRPQKRAQAGRMVRNELSRIEEKTAKPRNVVAETVIEIAQKERKKAIRRGDYDDAIVASIIEYYANQVSANKPA